MNPTKAAAGPLVLFHGAFGDIVLLTAMLQALAHRWGRPCDLLVGGGAAGVILEGAEFVGRVETMGSRKTPYFASARQRWLVQWLAGRGAGPCWVVERWRHRVSPFSGLTRMEWLLRRSGARRSDWTSRLDCPREPLEYAVDHQLRMAAIEPEAWRGLSRAPMPNPVPRTRLRVSLEEVERCRSWLGRRGWKGEPLVLLQTSCRRPRKKGRWPLEDWVALTGRILKFMPEATVLFTGSPDEAGWTRSLVSAASDPRVCEVASELSLRRLFALLRLAHSCVSLDTGPAQSAIALGCPLAVLSGSGDPRRSLPQDLPDRVRVASPWRPSEWPQDPQVWFDRHEVGEIPVSAVFNAWRELRTADAARTSG